MQNSEIVIKTSDFNVLQSLINNLPQYQRTREVELLLAEIEKAAKVPDESIGDDVIQLNSYFEIEECNSKKKYDFTLTLPAMGNIAEKKLSVLTPLGVALIGYKMGMSVEWQLPGGLRKMNILKVTQPVLSNQ